MKSLILFSLIATANPTAKESCREALSLISHPVSQRYFRETLDLYYRRLEGSNPNTEYLPLMVPVTPKTKVLYFDQEGRVGELRHIRDVPWLMNDLVGIESFVDFDAWKSFPMSERLELVYVLQKVFDQHEPDPWIVDSIYQGGPKEFHRMMGFKRSPEDITKISVLDAEACFTQCFRGGVIGHLGHYYLSMAAMLHMFGVPLENLKILSPNESGEVLRLVIKIKHGVWQVVEASEEGPVKLMTLNELRKIGELIDIRAIGSE